MLFKGSNNLVQIYRSFAITETTEGGAFLNMVFLITRSKRLIKTFTPQIAKYGIDIQIVRLEMTKFKMFREKVNMDFYFVGITF